MATRAENEARRVKVRRLRAKRLHVTEIATTLEVSEATVRRDLAVIQAEAQKERKEETLDDFWQRTSDTLDEVIRNADETLRRELARGKPGADGKPNGPVIIGALKVIAETEVQRVKLAQELGIVPSAPRRLKVEGDLVLSGLSVERVEQMSVSDLVGLVGRVLAGAGAGDAEEGSGPSE